METLDLTTKSIAKKPKNVRNWSSRVSRKLSPRCKGDTWGTRPGKNLFEKRPAAIGTTKNERRDKPAAAKRKNSRAK
jgi:hypothetical protein